ncbi:short chain dehydrogenase [Stutzerimonas nosocomialis]|uniref:SDR family oxidoreductase n=1 Tax=Stutzerimonas nosocomialis TaxID=1056496 RepID=UPI001108BBB9|nr:SDR family oxidoreductase [Stutzerimonas nosocomialis]TLX55796.1 short chain dehydrogenase [Stutzerimonas nosocomialis]TLX58561.1 short chain dehydrogenase [Stutzerimonas nosocomialis]
MSKTWFITGTSSGLGRILAERALARGDQVFATARKLAALDELKARYPERLHRLALELTDTTGIRQVVDTAFAQAGRIDLVVSNAGYGLVGAAEELSDAQIERQLATNLLGSIQIIRAALPHLRHQGGGRIVQVSSEGGQVAYPGFSLYHASKWGIEGFVETVAQEVAGFGIDFILAEPGPTATRFGAGIDYAQGLPEYAGTPADNVRTAIRSDAFPVKGDPERTVEVLMRVIDQPNPPLRLALGSAAFDNIHAALTKRLQVLGDYKREAFQADKTAQ